MEERLVGQTNQDVVRIGDTVRRRMHAWSPAVHDLLHYLTTVHFRYSPRLLGVDDRGREILTYIPGASGKDAWARVVPTEGLRAFATLLRVYHETVADFEPTNHEWALSTRKPGFDEIICHGDFGPWNVVWNGFEPVGILDWDFAHPAPTTYDVAYALEYVAPFRADDECVRWLSYPAPPDRRHRIEVFAEGYGLSTTQHLVDQVISTQEAQILHVRNLSDKGLHPQVEWVNSGFLGELTARVEWTRAHRNLFE